MGVFITPLIRELHFHVSLVGFDPGIGIGISRQFKKRAVTCNIAALLECVVLILS